MKRENGAFLVLLTILAAVLVGFLALTIDGNIGMNSAEQGRQYAKLAALAAIEKYYELDGCVHDGREGCTHEDRMQAAISRLEALSAQNQLPFAPVTGAVTRDSGDKEAALIQAGFWREEDPDVCGEEDACFVPYSAAADHNPNAIRIEGRFINRVNTAFAGIFGRTYFQPVVKATAVVVPRRIYFLVDGSPSVVRQNFIRWVPSTASPNPPAGTQGNEYAFFLQADNHTGMRIYHDNSWDWLIDPSHNARTRPNSEIPTTQPLMNYADDYVLKATLDDLEYGSNEAYAKYHPAPSEGAQFQTKRSWYRVHVFRDGHPGPEPLTTIMGGIQSALGVLKGKKIVGDQAGLIFFNNVLAWPRMTKLTDDMDYLINLVDFSKAGAINSDDPANLGDITRDSGLERTIRHGLFPEAMTHTNITMAVSEAVRRLYGEEDRKEYTARSIILFSDGLQNCCSTCAPGCTNTYDNYRAGMDELRNVVLSQLVPGGIPLHVFPIGEAVAPHTVDILKSSGECYTDSEFRSSGDAESYRIVRGLDFVEIDQWRSAYDNMSAAQPFYQAMRDLYELAVATQGVWAPLRPTAPGCSVHEKPDCSAGTVRTTDPYCRTVAAQIQAAMQDVVGLHPFKIVEVE